MNDGFKKTVRKLDTAGLEAREERREAICKEEQQKPQQLDAAEAVRRGMRSFLDEAHRKVHVERLKADPALAFFLLANRDPFST
jgi:hypothetical protein